MADGSGDSTTAEGRLTPRDQSSITASLEIGREILDPDGDVVIQIGTREFLVSSKILILASSVFKAMLKSRFREGIPRSAQDPLYLPLPDDDPEALNLIVKILHFLANAEDESPTVDQLFTLASLCDKYDLMAVMRCYLLRWLQSLRIELQDLSSLWKMSAIAMLMADHEEFAKVTKELALTITEVRSEDISELGLPGQIQGWS